MPWWHQAGWNGSRDGLEIGLATDARRPAGRHDVGMGFARFAKPKPASRALGGGDVPVEAPVPSEWSVRALAGGVLVFLAYPASELAGGGLAVATMAATSTATVVVVGVYLWVVWHRGSRPGRLWPPLGAMAVIAVVVPAVWGSTWTGLLLFPAIAAAVVLRRWFGAVSVVVLAGMLAGEGAALGADGGMLLSLSIVVVLGGLGVAGYLRLVETNALLRSARAEVARLAGAQERSRLGRDLHDAVKQELFVASMEIGTAEANITADPDAARADLAWAARAVSQAKAELSELIRQTRPAPQAPATTDLAAILRPYLTQWSERHGIPVEVKVSVRAPLPGAAADALMRAVTEALTNVARHAQATRVRVSLDGDSDGVEVRVADNGSGFDPRPGPAGGGGHGLAIMAERLQAVDASAEVTSAPGEGTEVVLRWAGAQAGVRR